MHSLLVALIGVSAHATPPDVTHSRVTALCRGGDRLALLVQTQGNQGSHYMAAVHLGLVQLDTRAGTAEGVLLAGILDNYVNAEGPEQPPERSRTSAPVDLGQQLRDWGTEDCAAPPVLHLPDAQSGPLTLRRRSADPREPLELVLGLGDRTRALPPVRLLSPDAAWGPPTADPLASPPLGGPHPAETGLYVDDPEGLEVTLGAAVVLETTVAVPVPVHEDLFSSTLWAVVERAPYDAARSWLVNAAGLDRHRAGRHREAAAWFDLAARLDPSTTTPRFNLACAWARHGDPRRTAAALEALRGTAGMAEKVAADSDFDGVRLAPEVVAAVAELD